MKDRQLKTKTTEAKAQFTAHIGALSNRSHFGITLVHSSWLCENLYFKETKFMPKVHNLQKKIFKPTSCKSLILVCFTSIPPEPEPKLKPKVKKVKGKGHHTLIHVFY